jgi:hypothetical protein
MENVIETNGEPVTIKITIEIVPGKKKEEKAIDGKPLVIQSPTYNLKKLEKTVEAHAVPSTPEGWVDVEPIPVAEYTSVVEPSPAVEPVPEKKKRAYTKKVKTVESTVEEKPVETTVEEKTPCPANKEPVVKSTVTPNPNKVVARIAQMIRFYCKPSGIEPSTITIAQLKENAFDIVENVSDDVINEAIKEASGK